MKRCVILIMCSLLFLFATSIWPAAASDEGNEPTVACSNDGSKTVIGAESWAEASALVKEDMDAKKVEAKQAYEGVTKKRSSSGDAAPTESECKHSAPGFVYKTQDIAHLIRQAQAEAISNLGGITANDADAMMEESKRILREEYGINMDSVSSAASECPEDHEAIAEASRNKGRIEATVACAVLFALYAFFRKYYAPGKEMEAEEAVGETKNRTHKKG